MRRVSRVRKYRWKPVLVEAVQYDGSSESIDAVMGLAEGGIREVEVQKDCLLITTSAGDLIVNPGDYIIKHAVSGEIFPCKLWVFGKTYEPAISPVRTEQEWVDHFTSVYKDEIEPDKRYNVMCDSAIWCPVCGSPLVHVGPMDVEVDAKAPLQFLCAEDPTHETEIQEGWGLRLH